MPILRLIAVALMATAAGVSGPKAFAQPASSIMLPKPETTGGKPLMIALKERRSSREFAADGLPLNILSDLLWAANGINRADSGKRTAPSAQDRREIGVYVVVADGVYLYDAEANALKLMVAGDIRSLTGRQDFVSEAPLNVVYVADFSRMDSSASVEEKQFYAAADTGFMAQNVYLYCASQGLATVVRGSIDRAALARAMHLGPSQRITLAQTVGFARK